MAKKSRSLTTNPLSPQAALDEHVRLGGSPLEFMLLKFQQKTNDPTSEYFLPLLLSQISNPTIYPALVADTWAVQLTGEQAFEGSKNICITTGPDDPRDPRTQIPSSQTAFPNIVLGRSDQWAQGRVLVQGLVNAKLGTPVVSGAGDDIVTIAIQFGGWTADQVPSTLRPGWLPVADALLISGNFTINQSCCLSLDGVSCLPGTQNTQTGWGTFAMHFGKQAAAGGANVTGTANATASVKSMKPPQIGLAVSSIVLTVADRDQMQTTVDVSSIPKDRDMWNKQAETALGADDTKKGVIANVNAVLGSPSNLTAIQTQLEQQMNAYLKNLFG